MKNQENKVQVTGVATATVNGNGNGKKAKAEAKPIDNVKIVEESDRNEEVKITPYFDVLTTKGVEMYTDMGNLENAKLYIDGLAMTVQCDTEMTGLMMLLDAISQKIQSDDNKFGSVDFIDWIQDHIFYWTHKAFQCKEAYIEAVRSGNFVVGEMPESSDEVWAEGIKPPKHRLKERDNALRAEINALAETVKQLQAQIGNAPANDSKLTKPADFTGLYLDEVFKFDWMVPNWVLRLEVQHFPGEPDSRVISSVYEKRMDGSVSLNIERLPDSTEGYPYSFESGKKELKSETETAKPQASIPQGFQKSSRYQLCELISQVFNHPDMDGDLVSDMWNVINDRSLGGDPDSPESIARILFKDLKLEDMISSETVTNTAENGKTNDLAAHLSAILNNPETPIKLYNAISDELSSFTNDYLDKVSTSPEYIRSALSGAKEAA